MKCNLEGFSIILFKIINESTIVLKKNLLKLLSIYYTFQIMCISLNQHMFSTWKLDIIMWSVMIINIFMKEKMTAEGI